jgi:hypothetical protein
VNEPRRDAFQLTLIAEEFKKPFGKINAVDGLIHHCNLSFEDLARLSQVELEIAFRKAASPHH